MYTQPSGYASSGNHEPKKPSSFDIITKLLLPTLGLIALILGQIKGSPAWLQLALLVFTALVAGFGFLYAPLKAKMQKRGERAREIKLVRDSLPELKRLARAFAEFVDNGRSDTFHYIVNSELCQNNGDLLAKIQITPLSIWYGFSYFFLERTLRDAPEELSDLRATMMEFHNLVGCYNNMCLSPVFDRFPRELESALTPRVKSSLNGFQQRFASFLKEYEKFVKGLEEASPSCHGLPHTFAWPKPLA